LFHLAQAISWHRVCATLFHGGYSACGTTYCGLHVHEGSKIIRLWQMETNEKRIGETEFSFKAHNDEELLDEENETTEFVLAI
jgi:hypothetical protein